MVEKIATDVSDMLNSSTLSRDFDGFVGMRAHMEKMLQLLRLDLDEVRMIGIWGPPGIGKTTIARVLFNQVSSRFQLGAFMVNIKGCYPRPCLDEYSAQLQLQTQMLSKLINHKDIEIHHLGVAQERLKDKKVFLVLDEVDQSGQLHALAKEIQWFGPGSRIITTTEDQRVLKAHGINHIYKVDSPSRVEAFQIFCMHAFGQMYPTDGFDKLAWEVMNLAGTLPLGLKVLGSALRGMSKEEWKRTLPRLKTRLDGEIESIIKFSYDGLCDEDKDLFLYLACFLNYQSTHEVEEVLASKLSDVRQGLHVLAEKSLISIENDIVWGDHIEIHTLLEQFGRETSRKQFLHHGLTKHQLLVDARDIHEVLSDDTIDGRRFIGIDISNIGKESIISENALKRMSDLQFVIITDDYDYPERLHSLLCHSQKIRLLKWHYFQDICLPSTFNPEFLVRLDMRHSKLQKLWEGTKQLKNLKFIRLSGSADLKELPDLSTATNLEELVIIGCISLVRLPQLSDSLSFICADDCQYLEILDCSFNNPGIYLNFLRCFSLNQEARDLILHTSTSKHAVLPGTQVPACFNHRNTAGDSLKIKLNESLLPTSLRFKACIMPVEINEDMDGDYNCFEVNINIIDKEKDLKVQCTPSNLRIYPTFTEHIYTFEVEAEKVTSTELLFEFKTNKSNLKIEECGILQILAQNPVNQTL